tara:strand:+ start:1041 stop:1295 length:255 start_codon:yes stop_codon:yes gene_type:complete
MPKEPRPSKLLKQIDAARQFLALQEAKKRGRSILFIDEPNKKYIANPNGKIYILPLNDNDFRSYLIKNNMTHILRELYDHIEEI